MLAPSSPVVFPLSSSPVKSKRPRATDVPKPPRPRVVGGFIADDDSDDDEPAALEERSPKRRMLDNGRTPEVNTLEQAAQPEAEEQDQNCGAAQAQEPITTPPDSQLIEEELEEEETERYERLFGGAGSQTAAPLLFSPSLLTSDNNDNSDCSYRVSTCSGRSVPIRQRKTTATVSYEAMAAARSRTREGRAKRSYYGIEIHELVDAAAKQIAEGREKEPAAATTPPPDTPPGANPERDNAVHSVEDQSTNADVRKPKRTLLWTEKYRARNFMDLVGDDLTNRQVLRWLKRWDPIVFPHAARKPPAVRRKQQQQQQPEEEKPHRQILMLTGPPGLGKTTLAHVCAIQAGYEVMEINASDDRSRDVVKGRIRTSLGTESVKTVENKKTVGAGGKPPKVARPVCVVVDEVDGVVTGSGGSGEGGFVKALIDLILLGQKNGASGASGSSGAGRKKKKGDDFRQMRPLILICNDVYHPSLRPLRQSGLAEIIHVGKPSVEAVVTRLKSVFEKEGIPCEKDAARKLCEAAWGITSGIDARRGAESNVEGDLRGVMVVGEWVAGRLRATSSPSGTPCLTRQWLDKHIVQDLAHGGGGARGLGRGGTREIVARIFQEGAGFPKQNLTATTSQPKNTRHEQPQAQLGFSEQQKKYAMGRLKEMIDASGEVDRIMTEIFSEYPNRDFNDDSFLTKPDAAYEWLHFHDTCSSRLFSNQDWELGPYISQPILACHHLFASPRRHQPQARQWADDEAGAAAQAAPLPFTGPRADFAAHEAAKANRAMLQGIHAQLPPTLMRAFRSPEHVATDFLPYLVRLVSPDVKPVLVGGGGDRGGAVASVRREGEKAMVKRAAAVLAEVGIALHKGKIEAEGPAAGPVQRTQWVYRMEPDLDMLATFETAGAHVLSMQAPTRYAVRQVLDQELQKTIAMRENAARQARFQVGRKPTDDHQEDYAFDGKENISGGKERKEDKAAMGAVKRDFFGRVIVERPRQFGQDADGNRDAAGRKMAHVAAAQGTKVWVTYHEGLNNAVRKPISLEEFLRGL